MSLANDYQALATKLQEQMKESGMNVTFTPFNELQRPEVTYGALCRLSARLFSMTPIESPQNAGETSKTNDPK
jgi:hypothetical protein